MDIYPNQGGSILISKIDLLSLFHPFLSKSMVRISPYLVNGTIFVPRGGFARCWAKKRTKIIAQILQPSVLLSIGIVMLIQME